MQQSDQASLQALQQSNQSNEQAQQAADQSAEQALTVPGDQIASWSGRGMTQDGLAKPDIYAPGAHIVSVFGRLAARSSHCARPASWAATSTSAQAGPRSPLRSSPARWPTCFRANPEPQPGAGQGRPAGSTAGRSLSVGWGRAAAGELQLDSGRAGGCRGRQTGSASTATAATAATGGYGGGSFNGCRFSLLASLDLEPVALERRSARSDGRLVALLVELRDLHERRRNRLRQLLAFQLESQRLVDRGHQLVEHSHVEIDAGWRGRPARRPSPGRAAHASRRSPVNGRDSCCASRSPMPDPRAAGLVRSRLQRGLSADAEVARDRRICADSVGSSPPVKVSGESGGLQDGCPPVKVSASPPAFAVLQSRRSHAISDTVGEGCRSTRGPQTNTANTRARS